MEHDLLQQIIIFRHLDKRESDESRTLVDETETTIHLSDLLEEGNSLEQTAVDMPQDSEPELRRELVENKPLAQQIVSSRLAVGFEIKEFPELFSQVMRDSGQGQRE
jgi:hypothetical protein